MNDQDKWYEDETEGKENSEYAIGEYDITSSPNDFNILTLYNFLESGVVKIPTFQRNYVWDIVRASKLIESLIIGLPIPQIFLYEESRNKFLVVDGQQRLMSIYYFIKQRFPRKDKRTELGEIFDKNGFIPDEILESSEYFRPFKLKLTSTSEGGSKLNDLTYTQLDEYKTNFDLRTIRNIIIKQNYPSDDDHSSIYEIFNRLNTGALNLRPQEIRSSLYHSEFDNMLKRINLNEHWRVLVGQVNPDLRMKDIELLLRSFGMMIFGNEYKAPMIKFLNNSARKMSTFSKDDIVFLEKLFLNFISASSQIEREIFLTNNVKFNISIFESVFTAVCKQKYQERDNSDVLLHQEKLRRLKTDSKFLDSIRTATANKENVFMRLDVAENILNEDDN